MAILRNRSQEGYTIIDNHALKTKDISLKALGLLVKMLSLPNNWDFSEAGLIAIVKDGQSSVRSGLKELEDLGYLTRTRERGEDGRLGEVVWEVRAVPVKSANESPQLENPNMEMPNLVCADNKTPKGSTTQQSISCSDACASSQEITPAQKPKKPVKHKHGMYVNVLLTDAELSKLQSEFPTSWQTRIDRLSEYMESTGKTYKNHLATVRAWARKDAAPPKAPAQPGFIQHEPGAYDRVETDPRYMPGGIFEGSWC